MLSDYMWEWYTNNWSHRLNEHEEAVIFCHGRERNQDRVTAKITEDVMTQWLLARILFLANMDRVVLQAYDHLATNSYIKERIICFGIHGDLPLPIISEAINLI